MKVIHVEKSDAAYRIFITEGDQGMAQDAQAIGTEQLKKALGQFGASEKGIADVLKQLETSLNAELRL